MTKEPNLIGFEELVTNCFSSKTLKTAKHVKIRRGPYIAQLIWDMKGTPFGDQVIWLFFSPRSTKKIDQMLQKIIDFAEEIGINPTTIVLDNFRPNMWYTHEVIILSDGLFTSGSFSSTLDDGSVGYIGWIVGQGRTFDVEQKAIGGILHTIVSNLFSPYKKLKNNPFIKAGLVKRDELVKKMKGFGATATYYSPRTGKTQKA